MAHKCLLYLACRQEITCKFLSSISPKSRKNILRRPLPNISSFVLAKMTFIQKWAAADAIWEFPEYGFVQLSHLSSFFSNSNYRQIEWPSGFYPPEASGRLFPCYFSIPFSLHWCWRGASCLLLHTYHIYQLAKDGEKGFENSLETLERGSFIGRRRGDAVLSNINFRSF